MMWFILLAWGVIAALIGFVVGGLARNVIHEIASILWFLIATVSIAACFIVLSIEDVERQGRNE